MQSSPDRKQKILVLGDTPSGTGGISSTMRTLQSTDITQDFDLTFVDPREIFRTNPRPFFGFLIHTCFSRPDKAHFNLASRGNTYRAILLAQLLRLLNVPYVVHLHGGRFKDFFESTNLLTRFLITRLFRKAEHVIALSTSWQDFLQRTMRLDIKQTSVIANGSPNPPELLPEKEEFPTVVFVGRLTERKGVSDLLEAFALVVERLPLTQLWLIGSQPDTFTLNKLSEHQKGVFDLGQLDQETVLENVARSWVFVLPSRIENFPVSVLEAMSVGTPVVASDVGGIPEIIESGRNGVLVAPGAITELASSIISVLSDTNTRLRLANHARNDWQERYRASLMAANLRSVWKTHEYR